MTSKNVAFILVPGSFAPASWYDDVAAILQGKGYTALPTRLESAVPRNSRPPATLQDDVNSIHSAIVKQLDQGKDVVLVMSSFGSYPGTQAVKGLSPAERGTIRGGSLISLVYLAGFLPPTGQSLSSYFGMVGGEPADPDDGYRELDQATFGPLIFNDVSEEKQDSLRDQIVNQSTAAMETPITYEGYKYIPSTYVVCEKDQIVQPVKQHDMIEAANKAGANVRKVILSTSGHAPMVSHTEKTIEILLEAAGVRV